MYTFAIQLFHTSKTIIIPTICPPHHRSHGFPQAPSASFESHVVTPHDYEGMEASKYFSGPASKIIQFMQRAAAASPTTPSTPDHEPSRGNGSPNHASLGTSASEIIAIRTVVAAEQAKKTAAIDRAAAEAGETKWVLSVQEIPESNKRELHVVTAGFEDIDNTMGTPEDGTETLRPLVMGRRSFGKFNRALEVCIRMRVTIELGLRRIF